MSNSPQTPFATARAAKGLSLSQVSVAVGYDRGGLSRIERGLSRPRRELASKLAEVLGITRNEILFPEEHMPHAEEAR